MNLRGRNKVSAEFNMSSMTDIVFITHILYADINHGDYQCLRLGAAKAKGKTDSNKKYRSQYKRTTIFY
jgi:biopolymer transport protein ExbD